MTDNLNLDIESYNKDELLDFFDCEEIHSKEYITKNYNNKLRLLQNIDDKRLQHTLKTFFTNAFKKLVEMMPHLGEKNNRFLTNTIVERNDINTRKMHPSPNVIEPVIQSIQSIKYPLGTINPIERKTQAIIFSLDTLFRNIKDYPKSNDFIYELPTPIENVINMTLINAEIPNSSPLYSEKQKNNKFRITMFNGKEPELNELGEETGNMKSFPAEGKILDIILPDGSPSFSALIGIINSSLDSQRNSFSFLKCDIDNISGNIFFRFKTLAECITWTSLYYYTEGGQLIFPPDNNKSTHYFKMPSATTDKIPEYNVLKQIYLGSKLAEKRNIIAELPDTGTQKLLGSTEPLTYIIDFNLSNINTLRTLGWSMGFRLKNIKKTFDDIFQRASILYNGYYSANVPYGDAESDYIFLYVNEFVGNYNDTLLAALENSYLAKSVLARIQIQTGFYNVEFANSTGEDSILNKKRNYFGPVNIEKLHIRILNKFGETAELSNVNYSLTFQFETLYSSIHN